MCTLFRIPYHKFVKSENFYSISEIYNVKNPKERVEKKYNRFVWV